MPSYIDKEDIGNMDESLMAHQSARVAVLVALACAMQIAESMIPHPVPGLRLGLANMLTLTALVSLGFRYALEVAVLRVVLSSFIIGTFMSPGFILSFSAAISSTLVMGGFYWLSGTSRRFRMSLIGISIVGAFIHNLVQLSLAYLLLVKHGSIFLLFPWLSIGAVITGWMVGVVTGYVCRRLQKPSALPAIKDLGRPNGSASSRTYVPGASRLHRLPAEAKILAVMALALVLLILNQAIYFGGILAILLAMTLASGIPVALVLKKVKKYLFLISISFCLPLFFTSGKTVLVPAGLFNITLEGVQAGSVLALRILLMIYASVILMATTAPMALADGLGHLLRPLQIFGLPAKRMAHTISLAWEAVPNINALVSRNLAAYKLKDLKHISKLLPALGEFIATLFLCAEAVDPRRYPKKPADKKDTNV